MSTTNTGTDDDVIRAQQEADLGHAERTADAERSSAETEAERKSALKRVKPPLDERRMPGT